MTSTKEETATSGHDANAVHEQQRQIREVFSGSGYASLEEAGGPGACLEPLLSALGWRGEGRHLIEAMPHFDTIDSIEELRAVLARLNFETTPKKTRLKKIRDDMAPALLVFPDGRVMVLLGRDGNSLRVFDSGNSSERDIEAGETSVTFYRIDEIDIEEHYRDVQNRGYMVHLARKFRGLLAVLLSITFLINLSALAVPVFVMNVYDKVIGTKSVDVLLYFLSGILIVILAELALREVRARALAYVGARCDSLLSAAAFQQILHLPIAMTERAPIGSQVTRLRQFDGIREIFTGTMASAVLDMPFMIVFLATIIIVGGHVAWVPVALIAIFAIMAAITIPLTKINVAASGESRSLTQNFLIETMTKHRAIQEAGATGVWQQRYASLAADTVAQQFKAQQFNGLVQTLAQTLVTTAGIATLGIGTVQVMAGDMTMGALIAVMALVWRVLAPVQSAFLSLNRLNQVIQSFRQVNQLMRLQVEREPGQLPSFYRSFEGAISLNRVGFRYSPRSEPALMGVTLSINPGEVVAIVGPSGAGKSTLLRVIAGLYAPQAGSVQLDGLDLRQLDVGELRHAIAYVPQRAEFLYGTIDQNIRLAHPTATDEQIALAGGEAGMQHYRTALPEGRGTRLTSEFRRTMPDGLKQRLMLARAYVKDAPVHLLDEPANNLDEAGDKALLKRIDRLRGRSTVILITHRPSHMRAADRIIYMEHGAVVHDGTPQQVLPLILKAA